MSRIQKAHTKATIVLLALEVKERSSADGSSAH
jgi:hypothetical protein